MSIAQQGDHVSEDPRQTNKKAPTRDVYYVVLNYLLNDIPQCGDIFIS